VPQFDGLIEAAAKESALVDHSHIVHSVLVPLEGVLAFVRVDIPQFNRTVPAAA
jgi:hypothetical protein